MEGIQFEVQKNDVIAFENEKLHLRSRCRPKCPHFAQKQLVNYLNLTDVCSKCACRKQPPHQHQCIDGINGAVPVHITGGEQDSGNTDAH